VQILLLKKNRYYVDDEKGEKTRLKSHLVSEAVVVIVFGFFGTLPFFQSIIVLNLNLQL
jgi:sugar phosphate permease